MTCLGDRWALETWQYANEIAPKYAKSKLEKMLLSTIIPQSDDLRAWWRITKKDLDMFRFAVRLIRKGTSPMSVMESVANRSAAFKTPFLHALEYLAYRFDNEAFKERMMRGWGFLGMEKKDQLKRALSYGDTLEKKFKDHPLSTIKRL